MDKNGVEDEVSNFVRLFCAVQGTCITYSSNLKKEWKSSIYETNKTASYWREWTFQLPRQASSWLPPAPAPRPASHTPSTQPAQFPFSELTFCSLASGLCSFHYPEYILSCLKIPPFFPSSRPTPRSTPAGGRVLTISVQIFLLFLWPRKGFESFPFTCH